MMWLGLMALSDGVRVESGYATSEQAAAALGETVYRVQWPDGLMREFASIVELIDHLREHDHLDELEHALTRQCGRRA